MPRKNNLKNAEATQFRSGDNAAENGRKGGIASGQARARKSACKNIARAIADAPISDKLKGAIEKNGLQIDDEDMNGNAAWIQEK